MSHRLAQVNELIRHQLGHLLSTDVEFPDGCLATIVRVETSKDLRHAKIWISILPAEQTGTVLKILKRHIGQLQFKLNKKLAVKPLPRIRFVVDTTESQAADIEKLLNKISGQINDPDQA